MSTYSCINNISLTNLPNNRRVQPAQTEVYIYISPYTISNGIQFSIQFAVPFITHCLEFCNQLFINIGCTIKFTLLIFRNESVSAYAAFVLKFLEVIIVAAATWSIVSVERKLSEIFGLALVMMLVHGVIARS